jgi:hypothetical protein
MLHACAVFGSPSFVLSLPHGLVSGVSHYAVRVPVMTPASNESDRLLLSKQRRLTSMFSKSIAAIKQAWAAVSLFCEALDNVALHGGQMNALDLENRIRELERRVLGASHNRP